MQNFDDATIIECSEVVISNRTRPEFIEATKAVSDYIKNLPLTHEQNDALIELLCKNLHEGEVGAFGKGLSLGIEYGLLSK